MRVRAWFGASSHDADFEEELASHVNKAVDELVSQGVPMDEARRRALARFGGATTARQTHRDARGLPGLDAWLFDIRAAARSLWRARGHSAAAVSVLAIGLGCNLAVSVIAQAVLVRGFAGVPDNESLVYVDTNRNGQGCCVSYPDLQDWRSEVSTLTGLGAVADQRVTYRDGDGFPESYSATLVTANAFNILGVSPVLGRGFVADDDRVGAMPVAVLSHAFWSDRYARNPNIVGRVVRIDGQPATIIGVMPPGFAFPQNQQLWLPLVPTPERLERDARGLWFAFGRIAPGSSMASVRAELATAGERLAEAYPSTNRGWVPAPRAFAEFFVGRDAPGTYVALSGAVAFLLLIAGANVANLLVARSVARGREFAVRMAIGASTNRIVRQVLLEGLGLAVLGTILGWFGADVGLHLYRSVANPPTRTWSEHLLDFSLDGRSLLYAVALCLLTALVTGLMAARRLADVDLIGGLKEGGPSTGSRRGRQVAGALVVAQMALAVVLLAGAGVLLRSFVHLYQVDPGVDTRGLSMLMLGLPDTRYTNVEDRVQFLQRFEDGIRSLPGVTQAAVSVSGRRAFDIQESPTPRDTPPPTTPTAAVSAAYFTTIGATLLSGRRFDRFDTANGPAVAIVNRRFADQQWPGQDALGRQIRFIERDTPGAWTTIVGVVSDVSLERDGVGPSPLVYVPLPQAPASGAWVFIRSTTTGVDLSPDIRRVLSGLDPELPVWLGPFSVEQRLAGSGRYWATGRNSALLLVFAGIALTLAVVGLYSVIAHDVARRTRELGIRMAIGGTAPRMAWLVLGDGLRYAVPGLTIGLAGAVALNRLLSGTLVGVSPADPLSLAGTAVVLLVAALAGCLLPASRAARIDPLAALRHE
ncbi:MAG: ADOP family duplicated permease [Vicinamibacterales bacterium]